MGTMGSRAHVYVALVATSGLASGCIFGGGKKEKPTLQTVQTPYARALSGMPAGGSLPPVPAGIDEVSPQARASRDAREKAVQDALAPKETAVAWSKAEELWLSQQSPVRAERAPAASDVTTPAPAATASRNAQHSSAADAGPTLPAAQPQPPEAEITVGTDAAAAAAAAPSQAQGEAVANTEVALSDAGPQAAVQLAADGAAAPARPARREQPAGASGIDDPSRRVA